ncbi:MAG: hypothetical protein OXP11_17835 [Gammaproteobacteria bacterium]|nr:hypothetical protein [Gammaproteobacteria bacterium]
MNSPIDLENRILLKAGEDSDFRERLLAEPQATIEREFGVALAADHKLLVLEDTEAATHLVLPPRSKRSAEEREAAGTGAASLEFLKRTMYDPAPPIRPPAASGRGAGADVLGPAELANAARRSIQRGLDFLESAVDENGAWHCIRFNVADPNVPRHFERPAFISALCVLALQRCRERRAVALCERSRAYIAETMEHPGLWRYYRHLPPDLDSTALCSLVIDAHPWIAFGRNVSPLLANRDAEGRFQTWILAQGEPDVVPAFRVEADPVVNANVLAYLGHHAQTSKAQAWLAAMISEDKLEGASKWYPDKVAAYYATSRAMARTEPALEHLRPLLLDRVLALGEGDGGFGNVLQTALAVSTLHNIGRLAAIDVKDQAAGIMDAQHEDGSWPELLAFGDQSLKWGVIGQFGHGAEAVTSAFCIEALECLLAVLEPG